MNVALYARVSSEKQAEKDLSLPAQLKALRDFANSREWSIVHEYVDAAESARSSNRPQFQEMIATAKQKNPPFQAILVWKLNRFARNREDSIIFKSLLRKKGVQVLSINEKFEDNATGKLMEAIVEAMDEFYSANLAQDTVRGMKENASRGFWNGGKVPYAYVIEKVPVGKNQKNKLKIIPDEAEIVKRIFALCFKGHGLKDISKMLNNDGLRRRSGQPWNIQSISYILKNETYTGTVVWRDHHKNEIIKTPTAHEALITKEQYQQAQSLLAMRTRFSLPPRALSSEHLLSTLLKCKKCGHSMAACGAKSGKYHYYTCQRYVKMGPEYCGQKLLNAKKLEAFVVTLLQDRVLTEENIRGLLTRVNNDLMLFSQSSEGEIAILKEVLDDKRTRRRNLYNSIESGNLNYSDIAPRIQELNVEIETITAKIKEMELRKDEAQPVQISDEELKPYVDDLRETLTKGSIIMRKAFIRAFVQVITVDHPFLEMKYTLPLAIPNKELPSNEEVLPFIQIGSASGI